MKYYDSSLYVIFSYLYTFFKSCNGTIDNVLTEKAANYYQMLNTFYHDNMPQHLEGLLKYILEGNLFDDFHSNINSLYEKTKKCGVCVSCDHCAARFYIMIALLFENKLSADEANTWKERKSQIWEDTDKKGQAFKWDDNYAFRFIPYTIERHFKKKESIGLQYAKLHRQYSANKSYNGHLLMLKGMSSSSPQLYNSILASHIFTCGGIYIRWNDIGIAIDPGQGFVENMYKHNLYVQDIDVVVITHFHIDHTGDIRLIDDLNRNINGVVYDFESVDDEEIYKEYYKPTHMIKWYVDKDTGQYYMNRLSSLINEIKIVEPNENIGIHEGIKMNTFHTDHVKIGKIERAQDHSIVMNENNMPKVEEYFSDKTFGICLELELKDGNFSRVGYSSDTMYSDKIVSGLLKCDYVIANISGIYKDDFLMISPKKAHLGYLGCVQLMKKIKPKIMIISEFWNGTTDSRMDICRELEKEFISDTTHETKVLPGEIGLDIDLLDYSVRCNVCGRFSHIKDSHQVVAKNELGKLLILCDNCCS